MIDKNNYATIYALTIMWNIFIILVALFIKFEFDTFWGFCLIYFMGNCKVTVGEEK